MPRPRHTYDHRLVRLVQDTGDVTIATGVGVPRSKAAGWLGQALRAVTSTPTCDEAAGDLRARPARTEARLRRSQALLRVLVAVVRIVYPDLTRLRVPLGSDKARLLRTIDRSRGVVRLPRLLAGIGLSPSRLAAWRRAASACDLDDHPSCLRSSPHELTPGEVASIRDWGRRPSAATYPPAASPSWPSAWVASSRPPRRRTDWSASGAGVARGGACVPTPRRSGSAPRSPTRSGTSTPR